MFYFDKYKPGSFHAGETSKVTDCHVTIMRYHVTFIGIH